MNLKFTRYFAPLMAALCLIVCLIAANSQGQTVTNIVVTTVPVTNVVTTVTNQLTPPISLGQFGGDFLKFLQDAEPFYTNGNVRLAVGGVKVDKRWGGLIDIDIPVAVNGQIGLGFAALYLSPNDFYSGAVNLNANTTWKVPLIGPVNTWVASGPGYNSHKRDFILYSATGATWASHIGAGQLSISAGGINLSDVPGLGYFAALSYGFKL